MKLRRFGLSAGEFYRAIELHYYCLWIEKSYPVATGENIILEKLDSEGFSIESQLLVREVVDWDCVDYMDANKKTYQVIVRNNNYLS